LRYCAPPDAGAADAAADGCELGNITLPDGEGMICPDGCNGCSCNDGQPIQTLDGAFLESSPVQLRVWVADDGPPGPCLALPTEQHVFDLSPIQDWYEEAYQTSTGTVIVNTPRGGVRYEF
jgi:hypothetical protein